MNIKNLFSSQKFKLTCRICYGVFIGFIILIALLVIISILPLPSDYNLFVVSANSMAPALYKGDLIFTKKTGDYQKNDVITFLPPNSERKLDSITHRIIDTTTEKDQEYYQTQGDANEDPDSQLVFKDRILGEFQFKIPVIGYPIGFAKTSVGLIILIIIPSVIIIYDEILKIKNELKKKDEQKT